MACHSREKGKRPKPIKKHRPGYTGRRAKLDKERALNLAKPESLMSKLGLPTKEERAEVIARFKLFRDSLKKIKE